jgi:hypothetical protein
MADMFSLSKGQGMEINEMLQFEFDSDNRILHLSYKSTVHVKTAEQLIIIMDAFKRYLKQHRESGLIYIIIDMTHLIIEPDLSRLYGRLAGEINDAYAHPHGIARYGHQITRVTVRRGYMDNRSEEPNLFGTRTEAENYIRALIARNQAESQPAPVTMTPGRSSGD